MFITLTSGFFFFAGTSPTTQESFCANTNLKPEQVATYRNLAPNQVIRLRELRGLTPQEICSMRSAKLFKALERLNPNEANERRPDSPDKYAEFEFDRQRNTKGQIPLRSWAVMLRW